MSDPAAEGEQVLRHYHAYLSFQVRVLVSPWLKNHLDLSGHRE